MYRATKQKYEVKCELNIIICYWEIMMKTKCAIPGKWYANNNNKKKVSCERNEQKINEESNFQKETIFFTDSANSFRFKRLIWFIIVVCLNKCPVACLSLFLSANYTMHCGGEGLQLKICAYLIWYNNKQTKKVIVDD